MFKMSLDDGKMEYLYTFGTQGKSRILMITNLQYTWPRSQLFTLNPEDKKLTIDSKKNPDSTSIM